MDKQKKRHISKAKFHRIVNSEWEMNYDYDSSPATFYTELNGCDIYGIISGDFVYWEQSNQEDCPVYYRKAVTEALA